MITVGIYGVPDTTHGPAPTYVHDHGVALMRDGRVLTTVQLERWTGRKHDNRLQDHVGDILAALVPEGEPVRFACANAFVGSSFVSSDGNLRIEPDGKVEIGPDPTPALVRWYPDGITPRPAEGWIVCHELAHIASLLPFVGAFEHGALLAHVDGGASDSASSFWAVDGAGPELREATWDRLKAPVNNFNVNPLVRAMLGFEAWEHLSIPGKLMGYAGWGEPRGDMASFLEENGWFLDSPDDGPGLLAALRDRFPDVPPVFDPRAPFFRDLAATIQAHFEERVTAALAQEGSQLDARTLYYAGGAGLNIPTNVRLASLFDRVHVPPATSDAGLALGAAAWIEYRDRGELRLHGPFLERHGCPTTPPSTHAVAEVGRLLAEGAVVGVCNGAAEWGPRALGHRSILARADDPALKRRVSEGIKQREWYQPLAPVVAAEVAEEVLGEEATRSHLAPYMLGAWVVRGAWRDDFQGVMHADGSVRAQVVHGGDPEHAWLHELLLHCWEAHGLPGLINTSFNPRGVPILHRHEHALPVARQMGLDAVVVHGSLHRP